MSYLGLFIKRLTLSLTIGKINYNIRLLLAGIIQYIFFIYYIN